MSNPSAEPQKTPESVEKQQCKHDGKFMAMRAQREHADGTVTEHALFFCKDCGAEWEVTQTMLQEIYYGSRQ